MNEHRDAAAPGRTHIVMVPGFVGFDALGQLEYYVRVTSVFRAWQAEGGGTALHYFDNFPTASVELRADRLLSFLAKRVARGTFAPSDRVALVGHSTGGLDIRKLLHELRTGTGATRRVDSQLPVAFEEILPLIDRLCFLSVPHFGTNFADFAYGFRPTLQRLAQAAGVALQLNREPVSGWRESFSRRFPDPKSTVLRALSDALNESDEHVTATGNAALKMRTAEREARAELALWLRHMARDFSALEDLRCGRTFADDERPESPAHFTQQQREEELADWAARGIRTLSMVTRVRSPEADRESLLEALVHVLRWLSGSDAPAQEGTPLVGWTRERIAAVWHRLTNGQPDLGMLEQKPGLLFELCYEMCAHGPFRPPNQRWQGAIPEQVTVFETGQTVAAAHLEASDNDGIVNTLSMLWPPNTPERPDAHAHYLLECDHGEIVGHYAAGEVLPAPARGNGRRYYAYDIFASRTPFDEATFEAVWRKVFDFCTA